MSIKEVKAQSVNPLPGSMTTAILSTRHWRPCRQETILDTERSVPNFALGLVVLIFEKWAAKGWLARSSERRGRRSATFASSMFLVARV